MNTLEPARPEDLDICCRLIDAGREFQREQGFVQWTEDYPSRDTIRQDLEAGRGYLLRADGRTAGYLCLDFGGEPAYEAITEGAWKSREPYAVIHRLALSGEFRGMGLAGAAFSLAGELCLSRGVRWLRADTDPQNARMQHVLKKAGFLQRGVVLFQGSRKLAYEKSLSLI